MKDKTNNAIMPEVKSRPLFATLLAIFLGVSSLALICGAIYTQFRPIGILPKTDTTILIAALISGSILAVIANGIWNLKDWAQTSITALFMLVLIYIAVTIFLDVSAKIFSGEHVVPLSEIVGILGKGLVDLLLKGSIPALILYGLSKISYSFVQNAQQRNVVDRSIRYVLIITALTSVFIVLLIIFFTFENSLLAINEIGVGNMLIGTIWRPGVAGANGAVGQFGMLPLIAGSVLATFGAVLFGVPLSIGTAILLTEVAPKSFVNVIRPSIQLLAGIPSVVYGLFGMVVLAPIIRNVEIPYNSGFGILNASIILAVMILPTITEIAEDAIRAVPRDFKEASLALGSTHWQTIVHVILPSARSGLIAAVILGIGRALGETMAVIMVIGNSIAIPKPLTNNPLTIFLSTARTLTGNIAVEINYATDVHRSALFFTGLLLFLMIFLVNQLARYLMRERK